MISRKSSIMLVFFIAIISMTAFSFFFLKQIDSIVHDDLYDYGLIFSNDWADKYWNNLNLYLYCQTLALVFFGISTALFLNYIRNPSTFSITASSLLLLGGAGLSIFAMYPLYRVDYIVTHDLYLYGLTFSDEWFVPYSLNYRILFTLTAFSGFCALGSAIVLYSSAKKVKIGSARMLNQILIAVGTISLAFSIIYSSSILALIGLGCLFWGITFVYVTNDEYVKKTILETTVSSQVATLDHLFQTLGFKGDPVYLPPRYFENTNTYGVYIPKDKLAELPTPEMMPEKQPDFLFSLIRNPPAILMTPPGAKLAQLFEKTLETNLNRVNLEYLQQSFQKLLVEDLEIAQSFDMEIENDRVRVKMEDSIYSESTTVTEQPRIYSSLGSPLSSSIACCIAKATGKPVIRASYRVDVEAKYVAEEYIMLENPE